MAKGFQDRRYRHLIDQLVAQRKGLGLSQAALAERLGTHQQFVSRYETGERRLDAVKLVDVASALDLRAARMLEEVPPHTRSLKSITGTGDPEAS